MRMLCFVSHVVLSGVGPVTRMCIRLLADRGGQYCDSSDLVIWCDKGVGAINVAGVRVYLMVGASHMSV